RGAEAEPPQPSAMVLCLLREALARESTEAETALALQGLGGHPIPAGRPAPPLQGAAGPPIAAAGGPTVRDRFLPAVVAGRAVAAFALSEPTAGSDAAALDLRADRDGDGFPPTR